MYLTKKNLILALVFVVLAFSFALVLTLTEKKDNVEEITSDGKDITKEEYIYKEDLLNIGYSVDEINTMERTLSNTDVKQYLLYKKYDNLVSFISSPYFKAEHIDRYEDYYSKHNDYSFNDIVLYVEIGLDYDFYTNMVPADIEKGKLILVNKYYYLDKDFDANLEALGKEYGSGSLNIEAAQHFREMVDAAKEDEIKLKSVSAYRSYSTQSSLYNKYVNKDGEEKADTYSARPGHSEHQTGLAVDINTASTSAHFENTKEYEWLINNSYKYGFALRYLKDKEFITGYKYEPWHFRYFGKEVATILHNENITYEEYLIIHK